MKNLNFAAVFFLFAYVIGSSWARDGDGEVDPGRPTLESYCWVTVWSTACTLCGEGPRILTLCGDDMCEDDVLPNKPQTQKNSNSDTRNVLSRVQMLNALLCVITA